MGIIDSIEEFAYGSEDWLEKAKRKVGSDEESLIIEINGGDIRWK